MINLRQRPILFVFRLIALILLMLVMLAVAMCVVAYMFRSEVEPLLPSTNALRMTHYEPKKRLNYSELNISKRPLFWSSRRPVATVEHVTPEPVKKQKRSKLDKIKLLGIMGEGASAQILVLDGETNHKLKVNDKLIGWELLEILPNAAVFVFTDSASKSVEKRLEMNVRQPLSKVWKAPRELDSILDTNY